jgi:uncharacterized protein YbaR (Trm112 family)
MKEWLMNILCCPVCRNEALELRIIEAKDKEILWGIILCGKCKRWFPIISGIPHLLPDELRKKEDVEFIKHVSNSLQEITLELNPPVFRTSSK